MNRSSAPHRGYDHSNEGDWTLLDVFGEVDLSWSHEIRQAVLDALGSTSALAVLLTRVSYIDSSGIAALVEGFQQARAKGRRFALVAPSEPVISVLELARLDRVFPIFDDFESARER